MGVTSIEWTERSWNPIRGTKGRHICQRVSPGCKNCYAATINRRFSGIDYVAGADTPRLDERALGEPLRWRSAGRCFVCSMTDLFWEAIPDEFIDRVFAVMALCPTTIFQVLTKRPERMLRWFKDPGGVAAFVPEGDQCGALKHWPLPNVWAGVSCEDQTTADARIPLLLQTPAAVRWVSYEPALGPVDFVAWLPYTQALAQQSGYRAARGVLAWGGLPRLNWLVVGGESGHDARPLNIAWPRQTIAQGRAAEVPVFVKQVGSQPRGWCSWRYHDERPPVWLDKDGVLPSVSGQPPHDLCHALDESWWSCSPRLRDRKGGDPAEWPEDLRVREYPR